MDVFLDAMIDLTASHRNDEVLSSKQVRSLVDKALDRMCEDDEFAELCNVLELDAMTKEFPVKALKASIQAARAGCDEWEEEEEGEDAGGEAEEDGGFLEAVGAARGTRDVSETRSAAASEDGYDIGGDESEAESIGGGDYVTSTSRQGSSDNFLALEFESPGGGGPRTQLATGDSPAAVLASALGLEGANQSNGDSQGDASGRSSPRYDLEELELDDVYDDSRSHRSGNLSQPNLTNTEAASTQPVNRRASVDSALDQEKRKSSLSESNHDGSGYDVGEDDESQDSADAAVRAARLAANTSHNSGRHQVNKSKSSSSSTGRDGSTAAAAALLAQRDAEVATLRAETDALRRAYAALEADALAKAEEQEAVIEELAKEYESALDAAGVPYGDAPDDALAEEQEGGAPGMEVILEEDEESLEQERFSGDELAAQALRAKRLSRDDTDKKKKQQQPPQAPLRGRQKSADEVIRSAKGTSRALSPTGAATASSSAKGTSRALSPTGAATASSSSASSSAGSDAAASIQQLQEEVRKLKQQLESMTSREQEVEKDLSALMQEFATATTAKEEAETKAQELTAALAAAQSDNLGCAASATSEQDKAASEAMKKEVAQLQAALASAQEEVAEQTSKTEDAQKALEAQQERLERLETAMKDTEAYKTSAVAAAVATAKEEADKAAAAAATKAKEEAAAKVAYFGKTLHTTRQEAAEKQANLEKALEAALAAAKESKGESEEANATTTPAVAAGPDMAEQLSAAEEKVASLQAQLQDMSTASEAAAKAATDAAASSEVRVSAAEATAAAAATAEQEAAQTRVDELQEVLETHKFTHFANLTRAKNLNMQDEKANEADLKAQWNELSQDEKDKYASVEEVQQEQREALSTAVAAAVAARSNEAAEDLAKVQEELSSALATQAQLQEEVAQKAQALQEQLASERGRGEGRSGQQRTRSSDLSLSCVNDDGENEESLAQSRIVAMSPDNADENNEDQQRGGEASSSSLQKTPVKGKNFSRTGADNNDEEVARLRATVAAMESERADKAQELLDMIGEVAQLEAECNALREASTTNASLSRTQIGGDDEDTKETSSAEKRELEKLKQECGEAVAALATSQAECSTLRAEVTALTQGLAAAREEAAAAAAANTKNAAEDDQKDGTPGSSPENNDNDDTVRGAGAELAARLVEQQKRVAGGHEKSDQAAKQAAKVAASLRAQVAALQAALDRAMDEKLALQEDAKTAHGRADAAEATATALTRARSAAEEEVSAGALTVAELEKKLSEAKEGWESAKEGAAAVKQQLEEQSAVAAEDMEALAAELVAVEEARDAATQALAAAQSSAAASPMDDAQQAPPTMLNSKGGSSGNMAHLRGQSPDAAFDLLKRTQTIDSLRRANAAAASKAHELTVKCAAAEARAVAAEEAAAEAKEALHKHQNSSNKGAAALQEAEAAASLAAKEASDAATRHESSVASAEVANLKAKLTEALSSAAEAATRAAIAEEEVANQAAIAKRAQEEDYKRLTKREAEIRAEVTAELATAAKVNALNQEEEAAAMNTKNNDSSKAAKRAAQAAAAAQSADVARATAAERAAAEEAEEAVALALQLSGEVAHLKAELDATRASRDAHAQAAERAGAALNDKHLLAPPATKPSSRKMTALGETGDSSSNKENRDTSTTTQMAHPPKNSSNSGSGAAARAAARAREAVRKEAAARVLALETTVAKQAAHIVSLRGQRDWLWPLLNFPVVFWMSQVSSEFSTFLAVFLGTVTLLAVAAKMGLFDRGSSNTSDSTSRSDPSTSSSSGDVPTSEGSSGDASNPDNASGGVSSPQSNGDGVGGWASVLRSASKQHDVTSTAALALMVLFFGWVLAVNPLDEVQYYVLGFCNPLLYGLPFAIHYALSPHAGTTKARPAPPSAVPSQPEATK